MHPLELLAKQIVPGLSQDIGILANIVNSWAYARSMDGCAIVNQLPGGLFAMISHCRTGYVSRYFALICVAGVLVTTACQQQAPGTRATDAEAIKSLDAQWSKTAGTRDVDATVAYYSDDAVLLAPNEPMITGKQALRASWAALLSPNNAVSWHATHVDVANSGELAYLTGTYQLTAKDTLGHASLDRGKIIEVFRKQADGTWKVVADMYNSDLPVPPA
jgi:ketosteroid isomerase-like protein